MHRVQKKILKLLVEKRAQHYSQLQKEFDLDIKFSYHLTQLVEKSFIRKRDSLYEVTASGSKLSINKHHTQHLETIEHKIPRLLFVFEKRGKYLIKKYFGKDGKVERYGLPGKRLEFGTTTALDFAKKTVHDFYQTDGEISYLATQNCQMTNDEGQIIFDFVYLVFNVKVRNETFDHEQYTYMSLDEIARLTKRMSVIDDFILCDDILAYSDKVVTIL